MPVGTKSDEVLKWEKQIHKEKGYSTCLYILKALPVYRGEGVRPCSLRGELEECPVELELIDDGR